MIRPFIKALVSLLLLLGLISPALPAIAMQPRWCRRPASKEQLDLGAKLAQEANFIPGRGPAVDQLIEVAKHFNIPMGIEWAESASVVNPPPSLARGATVQELIDAILQPTPGYQLTLENGVLQIRSLALATDPRSLLNLRLSKFSVKNRTLFEARSALRLAVEMTLYPDEYTEGYISDSGSPSGHVFDLKNITFHCSNLTVREILNHLIKASGNALWVARPSLNPSRADESAVLSTIEERQSSGLGKRSAAGPLPANAFANLLALNWEFIPLTDAADDTHIKSRLFTAPQKP